MKILKILFILLVPALGFVSCEKSNLKPGCGVEHAQEKSTNDDTTPNQTGARPEGVFEVESGSTDVVGSGDDDRDGGDKKTKKLR